MQKKILDYGKWPSPLSAETIAAGSLRLSEPRLGPQGELLWIEGRAAEGGRCVLVEMDTEGQLRDRVSAPYSVRTRVHEYGGGAYTLAGADIFFVNDSDGQIYQQRASGETVPRTKSLGVRFADLSWNASTDTLVAVGEDFREGGEPRGGIVVLDSSAAEGWRYLHQGFDFYAYPRVSPQGDFLVWVSWQHPAMPWDASELYWAKFDLQDKKLLSAAPIAGAGTTQFQPEWMPSAEAETLFFVAESSHGYTNLHRLEFSTSGPLGTPENLCPTEAEFALPLWNLGMRTFAFAGEGQLLATFIDGGRARLASFDLTTGVLKEHSKLPFTEISWVFAADNGQRAALLCASPQLPRSVVNLGLRSLNWQAVRSKCELPLTEAQIAIGEDLEVPLDGGEVTHAYYYAPTSTEFQGPSQKLPPLVVLLHGGPTAATSSGLNPEIQFWTSRGFAVADVNYRGSTGFGRAYRDRLKGAWGVVDVQDCEATALFLADTGRVNRKALAITGGSAGGFTALAALTFTDTFTAGASHYGISDLALLSATTHKFESRYDEFLIGPKSEQPRLFQERSPIHHLAKLTCPVILFQGSEDKVVPPSQAEVLHSSLTERGIATEYHLFAGEGHGFRRKENIQTALERELAFFQKHLLV